MRIAVIADIHANALALEAVLANIERQAVDAVWCLGDIVGRGFQPVEAAQQLKNVYDTLPAAHQAAWLSGNHERMVLGTMPQGFIEDGSAITGDNKWAMQMALHNWARLQHRPALCDWLRSLPGQAEPFPGVYLAHGAYMLDSQTGVADADMAFRVYVTRPDQIDRQFQGLDAAAPHPPRLLMNAHTHVAGAWCYDRQQQQVTPLAAKVPVSLASTPLYLNPGSVGFPREPDACPTYCLLTLAEDDSAQVEFCRVSYDWTQFEFPVDYPAVFRREMTRCQ